MTYSAFGLLAVLIHLIVNYDVLRKKVGSTFPAARYYRHFLYTVILFHFTDAVWGVVYSHHISLYLLINTTLYYLMMAVTILFWTVFVVHYLE